MANVMHCLLLFACTDRVSLLVVTVYYTPVAYCVDLQQHRLLTTTYTITSDLQVISSVRNFELRTPFSPFVGHASVLSSTMPL